MRSFLRLRLVRVLISIAALLLVAWIVVARVAGSSDPVTTRDALATFKAAGAGSVPAAAPRPGVYRYRASGTERGGAGPLTISRDLPSEAQMVVTPDGDGWQAELLYSKQHIEGARYVYRDRALVITRRRTKVTFAGFGRDDRRDVEPASVFLPADVAPGNRWSETYRTGDITVHVDNRVIRADEVAVGGRTFATLVVESRSTTTGAHPGTRVETMWWAPAVALPVRWDVDMDIGGVFAFRARSRVELIDATPAT